VDYEYSYSGFGIDVAGKWAITDRLSSYSSFYFAEVSGDFKVNGEELDNNQNGSNFEIENTLTYDLSKRFSIVGGARYQNLGQHVDEDVLAAYPDIVQRKNGFRFSLGGQIRLPF